MNTETPSRIPDGSPTFLQSWWRSIVIGILGGLLAFGASFAVSDTYASGTRLLIRGREASFLTDNGQNVSNQPGIVDASFAKTLGETQAGLVTSEQTAVAIVDKLRLDKKPTKKDGFVTRTVRHGIVLYARSKAVLSHGYYKAPTKRQQAISDVHTGLLAKPLKDSYILEIVATADSADGAQSIANTAADILVTNVATRARDDAARYADSLNRQLDVATADATAAGRAIADFKTARGISSLDGEIELDAISIGDLRRQSIQNEVDLAGATSQLESIKKSLTGLAQEQKAQQVISTGRSETVIASNQPSIIYQQLVQQRDSAVARVAELEARQKALAGRLKSTRQPALNADQAELLPLQQQKDIAQQRLVDLSTRYAEAKANAERPAVELTRIDQASLPNYPVAPKHYLYLALGLLLGGLAGWGITVLAHGRRGGPRVAADTLNGTGDGSHYIDIRKGEAPINGSFGADYDGNRNGSGPQRIPVPVGPASGYRPTEEGDGDDGDGHGVNG